MRLLPPLEESKKTSRLPQGVTIFTSLSILSIQDGWGSMWGKGRGGEGVVTPPDTILPLEKGRLS